MHIAAIGYRGAFDWSDKRIHKTNSEYSMGNMECANLHIWKSVDGRRHEANKLFYLFNGIRVNKSHWIEWPKTENETSYDEQKAESDKIKAIND